MRNFISNFNIVIGFSVVCHIGFGLCHNYQTRRLKLFVQQRIPIDEQKVEAFMKPRNETRS